MGQMGINRMKTLHNYQIKGESETHMKISRLH
jgi:hypothetical protein